MIYGIEWLILNIYIYDEIYNRITKQANHSVHSMLPWRQCRVCSQIGLQLKQDQLGG